MKNCTLPDDLVRQILLRLPMKYIPRCRRLSKYWNNIIARPRFTVQGRSCSPNRTLLMYQDTSPLVCPRHQGGDSFLRTMPNSVCFSNDHKKIALVVGTWDGLICLSPVRTESYTLVWNPLLKHNQQCEFKHIADGSYFFGFGFGNGSYKVIKIIQSIKQTSIEIHNLYTKVTSLILLSSNQVSFQLTNAAPVTVNGYSHWIGVNLHTRKLQLVWFDLVKEKFVHVPFSSSMPNIKFNQDIDYIVGRLPTAELEIDGLKFRLGNFKGSVCLFVSHSKLVEIWCMTRQQVWSKEFEMKMHDPREEVVGFNANDELVIAYEGKKTYVACNPWTQKWIYPIASGYYRNSMTQVVTYVESLVPVKPPKPD